jgi:hypothetical protein
VLRIVVVVLVAGCTGFVNGPPRERTGVVLVDCTDHYIFPALDTAAWTTVTAATIYWAKSGTFEDCEAIGCTLLPLGIVTAIAMPLIAAHGFERVHACRETKSRIARVRFEEEARATHERVRDRAWRMTKEAMTAARADNCAEVRRLSAKVRAEDADFHATVFVRDVAIARCL